MCTNPLSYCFLYLVCFVIVFWPCVLKCMQQTHHVTLWITSSLTALVQILLRTDSSMRRFVSSFIRGWWITLGFSQVSFTRSLLSPFVFVTMIIVCRPHHVTKVNLWLLSTKTFQCNWKPCPPKKKKSPNNGFLDITVVSMITLSSLGSKRKYSIKTYRPYCQEHCIFDYFYFTVYFLLLMLHFINSNWEQTEPFYVLWYLYFLCNVQGLKIKYL